MNPRSIPLDFLRTLAIFLVFTSHFRIFAKDLWFGRLGDFGWVGVDLFFVLSGFLISTQLFKEIKKTGAVSFKIFYIRRGFRIWPNYFFVLAIYFLIPAFIERGRLAPLWKFLTFTQNFGLDYTATGAFSHAWSLCVEEQFYLILPALLILLVPRLHFKRAILLFLGVIVFEIMLRTVVWQNWVAELYANEHHKGLSRVFFREIYYPTYCRLDSLATGTGIAAVVQFCPSLWVRLRNHGNICLACATLVLTVSYFIAEDEYGLFAASVGYTANAVAFGLLLIAAISSNGLLANFRFRWVTVGANLAFSFYLTHKAMIHLCKGWLANLSLDPGSILYPLFILTVCLLSSTLLYFLVEKPFLRWRDRFLHQESLHFSSSN